MTIYIDNGNTVKIYPTEVKVAKAIERLEKEKTERPKVAEAVMTLLETDDNLVRSETHAGYGVAIIDKAESECEENEMSVSDKSNS